MKDLMRITASAASLLFLAVSPLSSQEQARAVAGLRASEKSAVFAKVLLTVKAPAEGDHPAVESWIARKLRKRGLVEFRAVTGWVRLPEKGEESTGIWDATLDGELFGCPVAGRVSERTADGRVHVALSGWAPFPPKIKGDSLPADIGSRGIAVVDTGRVDGVKSYVALMIAPVFQTKTGEQGSVRQSAVGSESQMAFSQQSISKGDWSYRNGRPESVAFGYGTKLTSEEIDRLSDCGSLVQIEMGYAGVDSEYVTIEGDLQKLGRLKNLEALHLCKDGIKNDDLRFVALLPRIHTLEFNADSGYAGAPVCTDQCAEHLSAAKTLRKLVIHDGKFTDNFVAKLTQGVPGLEVLMLNSRELTDESLRLLAERCKQLKSLSIASDHFTADGLNHLDRLNNLNDRSVSSPLLPKRHSGLDISPEKLGVNPGQQEDAAPIRSVRRLTKAS